MTESGRMRCSSMNNEPMPENNARLSSMRSPTIMLGLRRRYRRTAPTRSGRWISLDASKPAPRDTGSGVTACELPAVMFWMTLISAPAIGNARIKNRIDQIQDQRRQPDRHDQGKDDPLDQEPIRLANRVEEHAANARVRKHHLDQDRPRHDLTKREGQRRCLG